MSDSIKDTYVDALVEKCEQQMRLEGWGEDEFDLEQKSKLPSFETCTLIDLALRTEFSLLSFQKTIATKNSVDVRLSRALSILPVRVDEVLAYSILEKGSLAVPSSKQTVLPLSYLGVMQMQDNRGEDEPEYLGPHIIGIAPIHFRIGDTTFSNPGVAVRLRGMDIDTELHRPLPDFN